MSRLRFRYFGALSIAGALLPATFSAAATVTKPNVLLIVADDLGYTDIAPFGGEIATPYLDALAKAGMRLTGFHTSPVCSPTRAMLLTGADSHEVGLGTMAEELTPELRAAGYEGVLNTRAATLAQRLQAAGYFTAMAGKWHLGLDAEHSPKARGFERSFALLTGGGDHFGADQQGEPYRFIFGDVAYRQDGEVARFPTGSYAGDVFTDRLLGYVAEARAARRPFFAYLAFSDPHWPLQAPADIIDKYKGRYDEGPEVLRLRRLARLTSLGLISKNDQPHDFVGVKPWSSLTKAEQAASSRRMEVYAAMVDRMDQNIGRVIKSLKDSGQYDNTIIVFMSDNGADGSVQERRAELPQVPPARDYDNSLANIGRVGSFVSYGAGWAQAATSPSRLAKSSVAEGGIHTPAIFVGPGIRPGTINKALTHVMDITPTLLDFVGVSQVGVDTARTILPIRGHSLLPLLRARTNAVRSAGEDLNWELFFGRAIRRGDWKAVYLKPDTTPGSVSSRWELFNLKADPGETTDLAQKYPDRLAELVKAWNAYAQEVGVALPQ